MKRRHVFFPALVATLAAVGIGASSAFAENANLKFNPQTGELVYETFPVGATIDENKVLVYPGAEQDCGVHGLPRRRKLGVPGLPPRRPREPRRRRTADLLFRQQREGGHLSGQEGHGQDGQGGRRDHGLRGSEDPDASRRMDRVSTGSRAAEAPTRSGAAVVAVTRTATASRTPSTAGTETTSSTAAPRSITSRATPGTTASTAGSAVTT